MNLINDDNLPYGWERVIGEQQPDYDTLVTTFSNTGDSDQNYDDAWFDVTIWRTEGEKFTVQLKRGPNHPHQDELDEPLREQVGVEGHAVEHIAFAMMFAASDIDPFTNQYTRGSQIKDFAD